ncbi:right-handed parallel beta-helix repeat-containing protein [Sphingomonas piscis]|uniref:Right-handed parallel beta-helix repeat-containing protein n=1 Tax=Sphingomonas piscis TaxID=2714943 RepID=A0A6G7YNJ4_9SPHN|nr:right-handed parallel beta-helix repeat-containing protein [Sphingomonas piscis]QIK78309.1 right-handed parallel beta-helix repeat-containing protein [Sphingomonas piscis]
MSDQREPAWSIPDVAEDDQGIDRRSLLQGASMLAAAAFGAGSASQALTAAGAPTPSERMPDGTVFPRWERPLTFTRTYHVDAIAATADDAGPGDRTRPFKTIGRAAELLQPGERVVIASGTYRECVRPARGGTDSSRMISYEAAPGAKVVVTGSEVLEDWRPAELPSFPGAPPSRPDVQVWRHELSGTLFPDAYNPFALPSIMGSWSWLDPSRVDMGPYLRRRGLVFADGKPLEPVEQLRELWAPDLPPIPDYTKPAVARDGLPARRRGGPIMQEVGGSPTARFWVQSDGTAIYIRLDSGTPATRLIEATTRQQAFVPARSGLGFIRIKGLIFQHAGNAYPFPQDGMVSLAGGDHWVIEDNVLEWANGQGLAIGFDGKSAGAAKTGQRIVIRGNTIRYCGVLGLGGMRTSDVLIEDNLIEWCGWADAERGWESSGAKFHFAKNMLFRRNVIRHMRHGNGAWWDVDNENVRVTQNVFADIQTVSAAVHFEMTPARALIDNNIIWDVRNAEPGTPGQRGCAGSGIFNNASSNLIVAHNLIGRCDNAAIFNITRPDRKRPVSDSNEVIGNIIADCKVGVVFLNRKNAARRNAYVNMPAAFQGFLDDVSKPDPEAWRRIRYHGLADWQESFGWDRNSTLSRGRIGFDTASLTMTVSGLQPVPRTDAALGSDHDIQGRMTPRPRPAGPFAGLRPNGRWQLDPRRLG